ncbi:GDSL-type esterase/lipase family protein [Clostridium beijerinckii]|uniref:GDSL-type esterase/lipase family protein n=1 Tax=Clostridium beijerinckii TaxID=1520 RepID=UPI00232C5D3E|nr:GDSL-type esterase/lipase family protein [Clostridium beijerinckii]
MSIVSEESNEKLKNSEIKSIIEKEFSDFFEKQKEDKLKKYKRLNKFVKKGQILFVGSSLMEWFPINEMQQTLDKMYIIYNRGIAGYVTEELLDSMEQCIFELEPSKIFINIGTNDMNTENYKEEKLIRNYDKILTNINERLPNCKVYIMAYYPVNADADFPGVDKEFKERMFKTRTNDVILKANEAVKELAKRHNYEFINVNNGLIDEEGNLKEEFSIEGIHMWPDAYSIVLGNMKKYL